MGRAEGAGRAQPPRVDAVVSAEFRPSWLTRSNYWASLSRGWTDSRESIVKMTELDLWLQLSSIARASRPPAHGAPASIQPRARMLCCGTAGPPQR